MSSTSTILVNPHVGTVEGATVRERLALYLLQNAAWVLSPLHDFGFSVVAKAVGRALPSSKSVSIDLNGAGTFSMPYCDPYWGRLLHKGWRHEPEIVNFIEHMRHVDYAFIDGGANYGYWSVIVAGSSGGAKPTVAIEAASDTYRWLETNCRDNASRFEAMNRALGSQPDQVVRIYGAKHEARTTVAPDDSAAGTMEVVTTTLDDVFEKLVQATERKFVVKLDVEGVEVDALQGGKKLCDQDTVFIYEEHGKDDSHDVSRYVKDEMGGRVFWFGDNAGEVVDLDQIKPIKKSKRHGYNFVATRSAYWLSEIDAAMSKMAAVER
ncbi:MAG: FkbM family methyltransferase [Pseudomonadota bacterium]